MRKSSHNLLKLRKLEDNTFASIYSYHSYLLKKTVVEDDAFVLF